MHDEQLEAQIRRLRATKAVMTLYAKAAFENVHRAVRVMKIAKRGGNQGHRLPGMVERCRKQNRFGVKCLQAAKQAARELTEL